jgi:hypothetical protein
MTYCTVEWRKRAAGLGTAYSQQLLPVFLALTKFSDYNQRIGGQ